MTKFVCLIKMEIFVPCKQKIAKFLGRSLTDWISHRLSITKQKNSHFAKKIHSSFPFFWKKQPVCASHRLLINKHKYSYSAKKHTKFLYYYFLLHPQIPIIHNQSPTYYSPNHVYLFFLTSTHNSTVNVTFNYRNSIALFTRTLPMWD
jgi:hypothetical protein